MGRSLALLIASTDFEDSRLTKLASPSADVAKLEEILASAEYGQFDSVQTLVNKSSADVAKEMWRFLSADDRNPDDFVLLYYSGHGILDDSRELFLACRDTQVDLLPPTAVAAATLNKALDKCRSRHQVLILDCCNSGSFKRGSKGATGAVVGIKTALGADTDAFRGDGQGRVVLTATDETQYAFEGDNITGAAQPSIFTRHLLYGLRSGEADQDGDGWIGVDELYDYVNTHVLEENPAQRPRKYADVRGEFVIARRPRGTEKAVPIGPELTDNLRSMSITTRLDAVGELVTWLEGNHLGRVLAANAELKRVAAEDDSVRVQKAAQAGLDANPTAYQRAITERPQRVTVLTRRPKPPMSDDTPAVPQAKPPEAPPPAPMTPQPPQAPAPISDRSREAWMTWALGETGGNGDLARIASDAAFAAIAKGGNSDAAATAARRAVARARRAEAQPPPEPVRTSGSGAGFWVGAATVIALLLFFTAPLVLLIVWFTRWSVTAKVIVAVIAGVETIFLIGRLAASSTGG